MAEGQVGNEAGEARLAERSAFFRFLRPFLAIYGIGIVSTFAWLFFALSGTSACATSRDSCQIAVNLAGERALVWPAYWGDMFAGEPIMILTLPFEVVLTSMLAFTAVLAFAWGHVLFERRAPKVVNGEPLVETAEPNRRNQSAAGMATQSPSSSNTKSVAQIVAALASPSAMSGGWETVGMDATKRFLARLWSDEHGISSVEYVLLLAIIGGGIVLSAGSLGGTVSNEMSEVALWFSDDSCGNDGGGNGTGGTGGTGEGGTNTC